jgi:predicted TIM-barrel fold metal-dependent hydrolase
MPIVSRRDLLGGAVAAAVSLRGERPTGYLVDSTHLWSDDQVRFPYHRNATYRPPPKTVEAYSEFARAAGIDHTVIIHSEVYQDDHRYLRYAIQHEPSPGYFKSTCLFDPIDPATPARIEDLVRSLPGRIVAIRIHEFHKAGTPPTTAGPMRDRDLRSAGMKNTWRKMHDLGLGIEMQSIPRYAPQVRALAQEFPEMPVQIDHFGLPGYGDEQEYKEVVQLAALARVYMRVENLATPAWYGSASRLARRVYDAFGPDRLIWENYGGSIARFQETLAHIDEIFAFATEEDRIKIRGLNAMKLFGFPLKKNP